MQTPPQPSPTEVLSDLTPEEWRVIPDTEGFYEVSNHGRIRSWKNARWGRARKPKLISTKPNPRGYTNVSLSLGARGVTKVLLHRLVCHAFVESVGEFDLVLHRDDIPTNNNPGNLYVGTTSQNSKDAWRNGRWANRKTPIRFRRSDGRYAKGAL